MKILSFSDVKLGEGRTREFILIEIKHMFSVIFYKWETRDQIRFHSHAFPSIAILLWGWYAEQVITRTRTQLTSIVDRRVARRWWPRFLPRGYTHSIKYAAPRTFSLNLRGPWSPTWREYFPDTGTWVTYGWGRKKLAKERAPLT